MGALDILQSWISPYADPMKGLQPHINALNSNHSDAVNAFRTAVYQLFPGQALQQNTIISGEFANAVHNCAMDFSETAINISELATDVNKLALLLVEVDQCVTTLEAAVEEAAALLEGEAGLIEITGDVDIAAVAEGGLNPIADAAALILTIIVGAVVIQTMENLAQEIYRTIKDLINDIHNIADIVVADYQDLQNLKNAIYPGDAKQPYTGNSQPAWKSNLGNVTQQQIDTVLNSQVNGKDLKSYFPPDQQAQLADIIKSLLAMGFTPDQINKCMAMLLDPTLGLSTANILLFWQGILSSDAYPNSPKPGDVVDRVTELYNGDKNRQSGTGNKKYTLSDLVNMYAQIANIPGAGRLMQLLMVSVYDNNIFNGYWFELQWAAAHKDTIARLEDLDQNKKQAADAVMKSGWFTKGAIVDTKCWSNDSIAKGKDALVGTVTRDKKLYPGYPIVMVFASKNPNGTPTVVPANVLKELTAEGATVMTSPPDTVLGVGTQDLPKAATSPQQLANSMTRLSGKIASTAQIAGQVIAGPRPDGDNPPIDAGDTIDGSVEPYEP
jgi:hypothetical protein